MNCDIGTICTLNKLKGFTFIEAQHRLDNIVETVMDNGGKAARLDILKKVTRAALKRHDEYVEIWVTDSNTPHDPNARYTCIS